MTPEMEERIREMYRDNFLTMILLPQEVMEAEMKELAEQKAKQDNLNLPSVGPKSVDPDIP